MAAHGAWNPLPLTAGGPFGRDRFDHLARGLTSTDLRRSDTSTVRVRKKLLALALAIVEVIYRLDVHEAWTVREKVMVEFGEILLVYAFNLPARLLPGI